MKLFDVTGTREYLELAKFFIDERGRDPKGETYNQDQQPVIKQTEAVGHSVRAGYMYAGMADLAVEMAQDEDVRGLDRFWEDVVTRKLYLTGGVGAVGTIEGFGPPYVLPNLSAYCETCASIANAMWNYRMFLLHGDAKYLDILERIIYNCQALLGRGEGLAAYSGVTRAFQSEDCAEILARQQAVVGIVLVPCHPSLDSMLLGRHGVVCAHDFSCHASAELVKQRFTCGWSDFHSKETISQCIDRVRHRIFAPSV